MSGSGRNGIKFEYVFIHPLIIINLSRGQSLDWKPYFATELLPITVMTFFLFRGATQLSTGIIALLSLILNSKITDRRCNKSGPSTVVL